MAKKKQFRQGKSVSKKHISNSEKEQCYLVSKKILRHFELSPDLIDVFSKKQKERLLNKCYETPYIKPVKERTVPRQYVRNISSTVFQFLKTNFWGNPENRITYMELATYGLSFLSNIEYLFRENMYAEGTPQLEAARQICGKFNRDEVLNTAFKDVLDEVWHLTRSYSRVNFRMYGFEFNCDKIPKECGCCYTMKLAIRLTAQESESKVFAFNNIERKAFRMLDTADGLYLPKPAYIFQNMIFPRAKEGEVFNIYVQSHVIHRFKERLDIFSPPTLNLLFQFAFTRGIKLVFFEKRELFACLIGDEQPVGYFTFFIRDNDLVINTFLPLAGDNTPEGKKLHKLLSLSKEEIVYIGMDKLSFFVNVDFDQIPTLKQALIDSNIWKTKLALDNLSDDENSDGDELSDKDKTMFVKNFFNKLEEYRR